MLRYMLIIKLKSYGQPGQKMVHYIPVITEPVVDGLTSGFKKCRIYPFDKEVVLNRLHGHVVADDPAIEEVVGETFLGQLAQTRHEITVPRIRRRKKLQVSPGKGITEQFAAAFHVWNPEQGEHTRASWRFRI